MKIALIGKHSHVSEIKSNHLDWPIYHALSKNSEKLFVISQGKVSKKTVSKYENIELILLPKFKYFDYPIFIFSSFFQLLKSKTKWDVVSASEPFGGGCTALIYKLFKNVPVLAMVQGDLVDLPKNHFSLFKRFVFKTITLFVCKRSDAVRVVSKKIKSDLLNNKIPGEKIYLLRNRVDLEKFNPLALAEKRNHLRRSLGWENNQIITFASALTVEKGARDFKQICKTALTENPKIRALIIGDGPLNCEIKEYLEPYKDRIKFTGWIPHNEISEWLSVGDAFLFLSHHEGMPRVVLEYLAMGKPVISTPVGGIGEVLIEGVNGHLFEVGNVEKCSKLVVDIFNNPTHQEKLGREARSTVENSYEIKENILAQIRLYKSLVADESKKKW